MGFVSFFHNMRVLLISPYLPKKKTYSVFAGAAPSLPPLGLAYLATALKKAEYEVFLIDAILEEIHGEELLKRIKKVNPDVIGISAVTNQFLQAKNTINLIKNYDKNLIVVLGGPHISSMPEETMRECENLDYGVYGEGEKTFVELLNYIKNKKRDINKLKKIKGIVFKSKNKIIKIKPRELVKNIDELDFPARELFRSLKDYSHSPFRGEGMITSVITSRGCPFNCHYCDHSVFGYAYRLNSPEHVIEELKMLKEKYGINYISFEDDNFALNKERTIKICKMMIKENLNLKWACELRVTSVDEEMISWMKKAGCSIVYFGIESGDEEMLKFINKDQTLEQVEKAIKICKKFNLKITGSFILGLPRETRESINKTINLALKHPLDGATFHLFTPYPNTQLARTAEKYGKIQGNWEDYAGHSGKITFVPRGFTEKELLDIQKRAYLKFAFRFNYMIKNLNRFLNPKFVLGGIKSVSNIILKPQNGR